MGGVKTGGSGLTRPARRRWSEAQKLEIIRESESAGAIKVEVCRRHGLHPSLLTKWRMQRAGLLSSKGSLGGRARLLPVHVRQTPASREARPSDVPLDSSGTRWGAIEVEFATGRRLCVRGTVDAGMLRTVLEELARS
ncbi:MAG: IS66-like element accessory protein TnpA [Acetobacteraceae bacterium]